MLSRRIAQILIDRRFIYVGANVFISALGFLRNVLFMRMMGQGDLGQIALMQTISMSVGLLQFGIINGGYRIYASGDPTKNRLVNNNVFACLTFLAVILLVGILALGQTSLLRGTSIHFETIVFGVASGIVSLSSTWTNNTLVAEGRLSLSNLINLGAASASLMVASLAGEMGLHLALIAVLAQPLVVTVLALIFNPSIRPRLALRKKILGEILLLGFSPFCAGVLTLVNMQIERWFITVEMGTESLGKYYIVMIYSTIFSIVPASLNNVFFPRAMRAYEMKEKVMFWKIFRRYLLALVVYVASLSVLTMIMMGWALNAYLMNFKGQEILIFLALPGLAAMTCFDSAALVFQSTRKMLPIFLFSFISLVISVILLGGAVATNRFSLECASIAKSVGYIIACFAIVIPMYWRRTSYFNG
jgi:O-antigen/teichoic acid export membrane protein